MIKKMMIFFAGLLSLSLLVFSLQPHAAAADTSGSNQYTVVLHHQLTWYGSHPESQIPGADTTFQIYDLTHDYHQHINDSHYFEDLKAKNQNIQSYIEENKIPLIRTEVTGQDGRTAFQLSAEDGKAYLIVQQKNNSKEANGLVYEQSADPIAFAFPLYSDENSQQALPSPINLYTKAAIVSRVPYFFKYGQTFDNKQLPLAGVQFVLYRMFARQKQYLTVNNGWQETTDPLREASIKKMISDQKGLVALNNSTIPAGTYYFQEVQTVKGFEISKAAEKISVEIPAVTDLSNIPDVIVNGQKLSKTVAGAIPSDVYKQASPRILNYQATPKHDKQHFFPFLPHTGEEIGSTSLIALLMIGSVLLVWIKKRKAFNNKEEF